MTLEPDVDIIVSGAGASGLAATIAFAKAGFSVVCAGTSATQPNGRTVALFEGSLRHLRAMGVWGTFEPDAQPIRAIRMIDDTGVRIPVPPLTLEAHEIGLAALGANVENDKLVAGLLAAAQALPNVRLTGRQSRRHHVRGRPRHRPRWRRRHDRRAAAGGGRRQEIAGADRGRHRRARLDLQAGGADRPALAPQAARQPFDRVPHPRRPLHAGPAPPDVPSTRIAPRWSG